MRNPRLKEHLLDDLDLELPETISSELERSFETPAENALRISIQEEAKEVMIVIHRIAVAMSVLSCMSARWFFHSISLEVLLLLSLVIGPFTIYQQLLLIKLGPTEEVITTLWTDVKALNVTSEVKKAEIAAMQKNIERLRSNLKRYEPFMKGHNSSCVAELRGEDIYGVTHLFHENNNINKEQKLLAEARALEMLTEAILRTDDNRDHYVGDAELARLALRVEGIVGMPFTGDEVRTRFCAEETRTLAQLADTVLTLYIEKRCEQAEAKATRGDARSPTKIGAHLLWKRKIDFIRIGV